jgi:hypothetical protein
VAVRPIELDLLSGVLVRHFIDQYRALGDEVRWVHLGDAGDFGCPSELERFAALVKAQGLGGRLAGFALGNHDVYFTGNFRWSPEWKPACRERVTPDDARSKAIAQLEPLLDKASIHSEHKPYFASLALLGAKNGTEVIGIFADSTDPGHYDLGAAGIRGSVGRDQRRWILAHIDEQQQLHPNVRFLLFMHHPYDALARDGRLFVDAVAEKLGERLLGMVSAHTHLAGYRCHEEKNGTLHELVVGSTLDPPSEAALIEVGGGDKPWVRMTTVPAIRRDGLECAPNPSPVPTADECRDLWLRKAAQCPNVFKWDAEAQPGEAEGSLGVLSQRSTLEMMRETRDRRAHDFLVCIGEPAGDGLLEDHERLKELQQRLDDRHGEKEILCAAWAASALKDYKARGWTFAQAVRWAFDGAAVVGALETRYTVGEACH